MELSEVEKFTISVLRYFDFLRKYEYEFINVSIHNREPYIVSKHNKINIEIVFTFLGKFDMEINFVENKFLKTSIISISLNEIISKSGYKLAPFVPVEEAIKWVSELLQNKFKDLLTDSKSIKEFKENKKVSD